MKSKAHPSSPLPVHHPTSPALTSYTLGASSVASKPHPPQSIELLSPRGTKSRQTHAPADAASSHDPQFTPYAR